MDGRAELLIATLARALDGARTVAVGNSSPYPAAAALLARALDPSVRVILLGSRAHNPFTDGGRELFDAAGQGRLDAFFLSGGQIDGEANINLVGVGEAPRFSHRFPGSFGSPYLAFVVPRVILFREEHTRRVLVPQVDFVSAPGTSGPGVHRQGGPTALVTGRCVFSFDRGRRRFSLVSVHPGETAGSVAAETGFDFDLPAAVPETAPASDAMRAALRERVIGELAETYPRFAARLTGQEGDGAVQ